VHLRRGRSRLESHVNVAAQGSERVIMQGSWLARWDDNPTRVASERVAFGRVSDVVKWVKSGNCSKAVGEITVRSGRVALPAAGQGDSEPIGAANFPFRVKCGGYIIDQCEDRISGR
jgi:hypothetical protein